MTLSERFERRVEVAGRDSLPLRHCKRAVLRAARAARIFALAQDSAWRSQRLLILCYHGISLENEHEWDPELFMPAELFEERMKALRRHRCRVLPLQEALGRLWNGSLPERSVCITFDDGYANFFSRALPILQQFSFSATVYLTTFYSRLGLPVFPLIMGWIAWQGRGRKADGWSQGNLPRIIDLTRPETRNVVIGALESFAAERRLTAVEKDELAGDFAAKIGLNYGALCRSRTMHLMEPDEIRRAALAGIDFQLHTHTHSIPREHSSFVTDIQTNKELIEAATDCEPRHFCYPNGVYSPDSIRWLRRIGIESAVTCAPGLASADGDPLLLPRYVDGCGCSDVEFDSWIAGIAMLLPRRQRASANSEVRAEASLS